MKYSNLKQKNNANCQRGNGNRNAYREDIKMVMPTMYKCPHYKDTRCSMVAPCDGCEINETVEDDLTEIARLAQDNEKLAKQKTDYKGSTFFGSKHGETK
jgi:hypothetical protein